MKKAGWDMTIHLTDQAKVTIVNAVCLIALVVVLKNVLLVPAEILSRDIILYIVLYATWGILYPARAEETKKSKFDRPLYWSLLSILVTLAIIAVYAR